MPMRSSVARSSGMSCVSSVAIDDVDINIFAKSRFVGTDKFWRDHGSDTSHFPRVGDSKKRSELARLARCSGSGAADCVVNETQSNHSFIQSRDGVDKGTDPIPTDPAGDPQTMLLGRVFRFDSPLTFESSPWNHSPSISQGQIRLARPGNKTEEGGTERWERVCSFNSIESSLGNTDRSSGEPASCRCNG